MSEREIELNKDALPLLGVIHDLLGSYSHEAYLVGGYVRDSILGRSTRDVDLAVRGPVEELAKRYADSRGGSLVVMGREERIARVVLPKDSSGACPWQVDFSPLTTDIAQNLQDRDFTIDALAVKLDATALTGRARVIDPLGGVDDLESRVVRVAGPDVFRRDPARLLRGVRLAAELNFAIDADTESLIERDSALIGRASPERIRPELCPILATENAYHWLRLMERLGLLQNLVPELEEGRGVGQPKEHFWDVYNHNMETVRALDQLLGENSSVQDEYLASITWVGEFADHFAQDVSMACPRKAMVKLAGLLHDVAKPRTKTVDSSGRIRFYGHSQVGAQVAGKIMRRLRFSRQEVKLVQTIVNYHLRPGLMSQNGEVPTTRAVYRFFRDAGEVVIDTVFVNLADYRAARGDLLGWEEWNEYAALCWHILSTGLSRSEVGEPKPLINGNDLIREFRLSPGPILGKLLEEVKEARVAGEVATREEALELVGKSLGSRNVGG